MRPCRAWLQSRTISWSLVVPGVTGTSAPPGLVQSRAACTPHVPSRSTTAVLKPGATVLARPCPSVSARLARGGSRRSVAHGDLRRGPIRKVADRDWDAAGAKHVARLRREVVRPGRDREAIGRRVGIPGGQGVAPGHRRDVRKREGAPGRVSRGPPGVVDDVGSEPCRSVGVVPAPVDPGADKRCAVVVEDRAADRERPGLSGRLPRGHGVPVRPEGRRCGDAAGPGRPIRRAGEA